MKKDVLIKKTDAVINETKDALQLVFNELNHGQQKKILKNDNIKALFDRYGVEY